MKRFLIIIAVLPLVIFSQENGRYVDYGLIRTQGNLAFGAPLSRSATNMYVAGDLDFYIKENISVNGGLFYFLGEYGGQDVFKQNHSVFAGFSYHLKTNNKLDPYLGFQPGITISQLNSESPLFASNDPMSSYSITINPIVSINAGVNYYANRFFNVFVNVKYQKGKHFSDISAQSLDELKLTLGLGYMIWVRKSYFKFKKPDVD